MDEFIQDISDLIKRHQTPNETPERERKHVLRLAVEADEED